MPVKPGSEHANDICNIGLSLNILLRWMCHLLRWMCHLLRWMCHSNVSQTSCAECTECVTLHTECLSNQGLSTQMIHDIQIQYVSWPFWSDLSVLIKCESLRECACFGSGTEGVPININRLGAFTTLWYEQLGDKLKNACILSAAHTRSQGQGLRSSETSSKQAQKHDWGTLTCQ